MGVFYKHCWFWYILDAQTYLFQLDSLSTLLDAYSLGLVLSSVSSVHFLSHRISLILLIVRWCIGVYLKFCIFSSLRHLARLSLNNFCRCRMLILRSRCLRMQRTTSCILHWCRWFHFKQVCLSDIWFVLVWALSVFSVFANWQFVRLNVSLLSFQLCQL